jgi:hypothetical protein
MRFSPDIHSYRAAAPPSVLFPHPATHRETRVPPTFCAQWPFQPAQNSVTRLWTACTTLKIGRLQGHIFR